MILENGAVFAYGNLYNFLDWPNVPENGFIELTDSDKMKPKCVDYLRGTVSKAEGRFGMFGTFHIVNYFFGSEVFLSSDGIIIASATDGFGNERKCLLSPIDPKWFGNEKIV